MPMDIEERKGAPEERGGPDATERFFQQIRDSGALPEGKSAEEATTAVLCTMARRVPSGDILQVLDTLPAGIKERYRVCMLHTGDPLKHFTKAGFLASVGHHLECDEPQAARVSRAVFGALRTEFGSPALDEIEGHLPRDLKDLWHGRERTKVEGGPPRPGGSGQVVPDERDKRGGRTDHDKRGHGPDKSGGVW